MDAGVESDRPVKKQQGFRRIAVRIGVWAGFAASVIYLYLNHCHRGMHLGVNPPDPVWVRFVNVALILFLFILAANLLGKALDRLSGR